MSFGSLYAQDAAEGGKIFQSRCGACHALDKKVVGPALAGITDRRKEDWLIKWIRNSQSLVKAGDADAVKIFNEYNKSVMSSFEDLTEKDVKSVLAYIKDAKTEKKEETTTTAAAEKGIDPKAVESGLQIIIALLAFVALVLAGAIVALINAHRLREGLDPITMAGFKSFVFHPMVLGLIGFIVLVWGGTKLVTTARSVGLHQNYQPAQPIAYSHKLHAGDLGINCVYCHVGAENGKSATIPSLNICMNCHNYVEKGPKHGTKEIAKLKEAYDKGKPVEWVRIHNLPDFVYFNHKQHVVAGGQQCQTCHGPVETMDEVYQFSPLSMGWCINCHRETEVDVNKNDYYTSVHDEWVKKKEAAKKDGREVRVTVSDLGGLDCAKCHY